MSDRVLIISPVRNEAAHIEAVVRSVAAQEAPPAEWVVIDDGSTDGTFELLQALEGEVPFMRVLRTQRDVAGAGRRDRLAIAAEIRSFNEALATVEPGEYTHIMKLDGDIELRPHYLRLLLERFTADPRLGLAGGVLDEPGDDGRMRRVKIPSHHVHGALKCYSRACFAAIGGVQRRLAWDTIDETYARMLGFKTVSFDDLVSIHRRPCGTADGALRGRARHGECAYICHYPAAWVALRSLKVGATARPLGASGVALLLGYSRAWARGIEQVSDPAFREFTRGELRDRAAAALTRARGPRADRTASGATWTAT